MQYHYAVNTAAGHCSLGIRMLGMQRFINSLQIGPKVFEIPPNASLSLSLSICLFLPLLNSHPVCPTNKYTGCGKITDRFMLFIECLSPGVRVQCQTQQGAMVL